MLWTVPFLTFRIIAALSMVTSLLKIHIQSAYSRQLKEVLEARDSTAHQLLKQSNTGSIVESRVRSRVESTNSGTIYELPTLPTDLQSGTFE